MLKSLTLTGTMLSGLLAGGLMAAPLLLASGPALAQTAPTCGAPVNQPCPTTVPFQGEQLQTGNVTASVVINGQSVTVTPTPTDGSPATVTASDITSLSSAMGNNLSYKVQNELRLEGSAAQSLFGSVEAYNVVTAPSAVPGVVVSVTSAYGNTAQAEACCGGMDIALSQSANTGSILADARLSAGPGLGTLSMSSTATANAIGTSVTNGPLTLRGTQSNAVGVYSSSQANVCCNLTTGSITVGATAVANSAASTSSTSTVYSTNRQTNSGAINADSSHVTNSGRAITSATQATGNSVYTLNQWGYTSVDAVQSNTGAVSTKANLTANNFVDFAVVGGTSTGNSILLSNQGSDATLVGYQDNGVGGTVSSTTYFDGTSASGGVATATGMSIGNAMTGYACSGCGQNLVKLEGYFGQTNAANITTTVSMGAGTGSAITGQATAVGNSATFIAQRNN
jgi:hypothetical protein